MAHLFYPVSYCFHTPVSNPGFIPGLLLKAACAITRHRPPATDTNYRRFRFHTRLHTMSQSKLETWMLVCCLAWNSAVKHALEMCPWKNTPSIARHALVVEVLQHTLETETWNCLEIRFETKLASRLQHKFNSKQNIHIYKGLRYSTLQKYFHFCLFMFTLFSLFLLLHFYYVSYFLSCFFILWKL